MFTISSDETCRTGKISITKLSVARAPCLAAADGGTMARVFASATGRIW